MGSEMCIRDRSGSSARSAPSGTYHTPTPGAGSNRGRPVPGSTRRAGGCVAAHQCTSSPRTGTPFQLGDLQWGQGPPGHHSASSGMTGPLKVSSKLFVSSTGWAKMSGNLTLRPSTGFITGSIFLIFIPK